MTTHEVGDTNTRSSDPPARTTHTEQRAHDVNTRTLELGETDVVHDNHSNLRSRHLCRQSGYDVENEPQHLVQVFACEQLRA